MSSITDFKNKNKLRSVENQWTLILAFD